AASRPPTSPRMRGSGRRRSPSPALPAQASANTVRPTCTTTPALAESPTAVAASAVPVPDRARKRVLRARPPTLAGVMRLVNDVATCAAKDGTTGTGDTTAPRRATVAATYDDAVTATTTSTQPVSARVTSCHR